MTAVGDAAPCRRSDASRSYGPSTPRGRTTGASHRFESHAQGRLLEAIRKVAKSDRVFGRCSLTRDRAGWPVEPSLPFNMHALSELRPQPKANDLPARLDYFSKKFCANLGCVEAFCAIHSKLFTILTERQC
jgi:hypothetical protein